jgi:hypothetical protein
MAGLPDVMFSNQKFQFVSILEGLKIKKKVGIFYIRQFGLFYGHFVYSMAIW